MARERGENEQWVKNFAEEVPEELLYEGVAAAILCLTDDVPGVGERLEPILGTLLARIIRLEDALDGLREGNDA